MKPKAEWERDKIWVIGSSYCHTRQFKVDETTFKIFKEFNKLIGQCCNVQHQQLFSTVEEKMKKLRLGLKSYRYFDQAKALADKLRDSIKRKHTK